LSALLGNRIFRIFVSSYLQRNSPPELTVASISEIISPTAKPKAASEGTIVKTLAALLPLLAALASVSTAQAASEILTAPQISAKSSTVSVPLDRSSVTEAGAIVSSINDGALFGTVGFFHEYEDGFTLGGRAVLPMQYSHDAQVYAAQGVGRFMLSYDANQMYLEATISEDIFTKQGETLLTTMVGANYGYMRVISQDVRIGAAIGLDYSRDRIEDNAFAFNSPTVYNKFAIMGSLYF
jgi:CubicO group peptidase (beta-lactamase class C family)